MFVLCFFFALMLLNTERKAGRILDAKCESQLLHTEDVKSDCRMEKIAPKLGKKLLQCEKKRKASKTRGEKFFAYISFSSFELWM